VPDQIVAALNMAKSRRMKFLLVAKGTDAGRLLMSPSKVKGEDVKAAMTETKGKVVARGECYRTGKLMFFECLTKPPTTLRNLLTKTIKTEAKLSLVVQARHAGEVASEQEQVAKNRAALVDRVKRVSDLMKDLKSRVDGSDWSAWNDIRTKAVLEAKEAKDEKAWKVVLDALDELEEDLDDAMLETAEGEEASQKLLERQEEALKTMNELETRVAPPIWKKLTTQNKDLTKTIAAKDWKKGNQQLRDLLKEIKTAEIAAAKSDALDDDGEGMRRLFGDDMSKEEKEEADVRERDKWKKQIQVLAERAGKLAGPDAIRLRNRVAGLFQMLSSKDWKDVEASVKEAVGLLNTAEKAEQAENEKQRTKFTTAIKDLAKRARNLKDAKGNDLGKSVIELTGLLPKKDWKTLEKQLAEVEKDTDEAENRLSKDDEIRIALTADIKKLATRAAKLNAPVDVPVRNRVAGLFGLLNSKDWKGVRESLAEATKLVEAAEKRG
jgi:hypothetical protein